MDYPTDGVVAEAFWAAEWLHCNCHRMSAEREAADELESQLRALPHALAPDVIGTV